MSSSENDDELQESIFTDKSKKYTAKGTVDSPISLSSNSPSSSPFKKKSCRSSVHEAHVVAAKRDIFMSRLTLKEEEASQYVDQSESEDDEYDDSDESDEPEPRCYCDDPALPVFSYSSLPMGKEKLVQCMIEEHPSTALCCDQPINVKSNVTFLVDLSKLPHRDDVKCDDLGAWRHTGSPSCFCTVSQDGKVVFQSGKPKYIKEDMYKLKRVYYVHASSPDLKKKIAYLYDHHGEEMSICVVQYLFDGPEHEVAVRKPHGNSTKNKKAYRRTLSSVRDKMKESVDSKLTPKQSLDKIYKESGDVLGARSLGSLPSGPQSIYNARMSAKGHKSATAKEDSIFIILEQARREAITAGSTAFIRDIKIHPEYCCVLATNKQLHQLQVFCTNPKEFCVLGVDPTFDIFDTNISLTMTTYRNLKLEHKETGKPPVFIGPLLMHQRKQRSTYGYFAHSLVSLHEPLKGVLAVGTDGEQALISGFQDHLMFAVFLRCFIHFEENFKSHILSMGIPAKVAKEYLRDVFGEMRGSTFYQGLVDSPSEAVFDQKLGKLKDVWNAREEPYVPKGKKASVHDWFTKYKATDMKTSMIAPVRTDAGLGSPPMRYTTNDTEAGNFMTKHHLHFDKSNPHSFVGKVLDLIESQQRNEVRAIIGKGPFHLRESYKHYELSDRKWAQMSIKQREEHLKKYDKATVSDADPCITSTTSTDKAASSPVNLSVSAANSAIVTIPYPIVCDMFRRAEELLTGDGLIIPKPGATDNSYIVAGMKNKVHIVEQGKGRSIKCDSSCPNQGTGICEHVIAVAERRGVLKGFLEFFNKTGRGVNLTNIVLQSGPVSAGRKASSRKRTNIARKTPDAYDDRLRQLDTSTVTRPSAPQKDTWQTIQNAQAISNTTLVWPAQSTSNTVGSQPVLTAGPPGIHQSLSPNNENETPGKPDPPQGLFETTILRYCDPRVTTCYGCGQPIRPQGVILPPPSDLVVVGKMRREYFSGDQRRQSKVGNVYFHCNLRCIREKQCHFLPSLMFVSPYVRPMLTHQHRAYLLSTVGFSV